MVIIIGVNISPWRNKYLIILSKRTNKRPCYKCSPCTRPKVCKPTPLSKNFIRRALKMSSGKLRNPTVALYLLYIYVPDISSQLSISVPYLRISSLCISSQHLILKSHYSSPSRLYMYQTSHLNLVSQYHISGYHL